MQEFIIGPIFKYHSKWSTVVFKRKQCLRHVCLPRCANAYLTDSLQSRSRRAPSWRASKHVCALQVSNPRLEAATQTPRWHGKTARLIQWLTPLWIDSDTHLVKVCIKCFFRGERESSDGRKASNFHPHTISFRAIAWQRWQRRGEMLACKINNWHDVDIPDARL